MKEGTERTEWNGTAALKISNNLLDFGNQLLAVNILSWYSISVIFTTTTRSARAAHSYSKP
jgi:hypothetical protein